MPLRIDTGDLLFAIESNNDELDHYLDLQTGEIVMVMSEAISGEPEMEDIADDEERYRHIEPISSRDGWCFMRDFAEDVADEEIRGRLLHAIQGSGAFGRFKHVLSFHPDLRESWFRFRDEQLLECAREWLAAENIEAELIEQRARVADD